MSEERKSALRGFHAFTGNNYLSSISGKLKNICWKAVTKSSKYARMFNKLGETVNLDLEFHNALGRFCVFFIWEEQKRYL